jgi:hypothetical protein
MRIKVVTIAQVGNEDSDRIRNKVGMPEWPVKSVRV